MVSTGAAEWVGWAVMARDGNSSHGHGELQNTIIKNKETIHIQ
jgi:hypothetical protein